MAHLTHDEVNQCLAGAWGEKHGADLEALDARDLPATSSYQAILVDHDSLDPVTRTKALDHLLSLLPGILIVVYSYGLDEEAIRALTAHGVVVWRGLDEGRFQRLVRLGHSAA
jgi:hypothetical protein